MEVRSGLLAGRPTLLAREIAVVASRGVAKLPSATLPVGRVKRVW